jgi:hypothetical protein
MAHLFLEGKSIDSDPKKSAKRRAPDAKRRAPDLESQE